MHSQAHRTHPVQEQPGLRLEPEHRTHYRMRPPLAQGLRLPDLLLQEDDDPDDDPVGVRWWQPV